MGKRQKSSPACSAAEVKRTGNALELANENLFFWKDLVVRQMRDLDACVGRAAIRSQDRRVDDHGRRRQLVLGNVEAVVECERFLRLVFF